MIDAKNNWSGIVGVVADPEFVSDNIINFRVAVDGAGRDREKDDYSGYFTVKYFINDENASNAKFVKGQIEAGNIKKGTTLGVVGKIMHERWTKDDQRMSTVTIWAENLTYVGRRSDPDASSNTGGTEEATAQATASIPSSF